MNLKELLIATGNPGKFHEIQEALSGLPLKLLFLPDLKIPGGDFVEDGETFKENAYKKAKFFYERSGGILTLGEDSGIIVEALRNELGVRTRRWGVGERATDQEWVEYFLKRLKGVDDRRAEFYCCACLYGEEVEEYFYGETLGVITAELLAPVKAGIPLSSCFVPEGMDKVYAALSPIEKNAVSHRGKAMGKVRDWLEKAWIAGGVEKAVAKGVS